MDVSKGDSEFLARYQGLAFSQQLEDGSPSEKADILRKTLAHLHYAPLCGLTEEAAVKPLIQQYETMYGNIVDCFDEETGLNNFAEGALSLCSGKKNESKDWKSSLNVDKILSMKTVQQHLNRALVCGIRAPDKVSREKDLPKSRRGEVLPLTLQKMETDGASGLSSKPTQSNKVLNLYSNQPGNDRPDMAQQSTRNNADPAQSVTRDGGGYKKPLFSGGGKQSAFGQYGSRQNQPAVDNYEHQGGVQRPSFRGQPADNIRGQATDSFRGQAADSYRGQSADRYSGRAADGYRDQSGDSYRGQSADRYRGHAAGGYRGQSSDSCRGQPADRQEEERPMAPPNVFKTAKQQLAIDNQRKYGGGGGGGGGGSSVNTSAYGTGKKSLGTRRGLSSKFVPPVMNREESEDGRYNNTAANTITRAVLKTGGAGNDDGSSAGKFEGMDEDKLKGVEAKMIEMIMNEIMDSGPSLTWDDVAGLEFAKKTIKEIVVWPMLRPDIFTGLRGPPKGLLLFGPPGTGKTLIGKCIASQSKSTFFCISASSLTSKWVGEGEKMVRALFAVARAQQPAVVFIDEIDSLLTQRTDGENEASRRIKTEFLVQLDGASTSSEDRILVIGATNRPQEIDEAARRRFVKRLYIPLPEQHARKTIIVNLLRQQAHQLSDHQLDTICTHTDGFSGADMASLCREAALGPIRDMSFGDIENISVDQVRAITVGDFEEALQNVKPSVSDKDLDQYLEWNKTFGSGSR